MEKTNRFVVLTQSGRFTVTALCEQFGLSCYNDGTPRGNTGFSVFPLLTTLR